MADFFDTELTNALDRKMPPLTVIDLSAPDLGTERTAGVGTLLAGQVDRLGGVTSTTGANLVGYDDSGSKTTAATVGDALDELYAKATNALGTINLGLFSARIVDADGDVAAIAVASGNGGQLASDTAPILEANGTTNAQQLRWIANGVERICFDPVALPADFDDTGDCTVSFFFTTNGTANAPSLTVVTNWDGGADVSDTTAAGVAQTAIQTITATVANGDIPAGARVVNVSITPGAHGTDAWNLHGARIRYTKKLTEA